MLEVIKIAASTVDLNYTRLVWELRVTGEDPLDYDFYILRSGSAAGPFDVLAGPIRYDTYEFLDGDVYHQNKFRRYFYRVRAVHRGSGQVREYPHDSAAWVKARPTLIATELRRQERVLFREFSGRRAVLLPLRRFGRRCPRCWDPVAGRKVISQCLTCFDTTYVGGYLQPIEIFIQIDPSPKVQQNNAHGREGQDNTRARKSSFPPTMVGDVIVEAENIRWRITQVSTTQRLRAVAHEELQLHYIVPDQIEYEFPIFWPEDFEASPAREFTNPMTPGGDDDWVW